MSTAFACQYVLKKTFCYHDAGVEDFFDGVSDGGRLLDGVALLASLSPQPDTAARPLNRFRDARLTELAAQAA